MSEKEVIALVCEVLELGLENVTVGQTLVSLGWDSLSALEFLALVDRRHGISLSAPALSNAVTVGDLRSAFGR